MLFCDELLPLISWFDAFSWLFLCCILNVQICYKDQISASLHSFHISSAAAPCSDFK